MIETKTEVKTFKVNAQCDCGGELHNTGLMLKAYPPLYQHRCDWCKKLENLKAPYPRTVYD